MKYYYYVAETVVTEKSTQKNTMAKFRFIHVIQTDGALFPITKAVAQVFGLSVAHHLPGELSKGLFTTAILNQSEISVEEFQEMKETNQYEGRGILTDLVIF